MRNIAKSYEIDMCNGPLPGKILIFSVPLILSSIIQLLFNAADVVVVGRFAGSEALAAVGSTGSLINLIVNVFMGLSVGVNVLVSRYYGGGKKRELSEMVHTAVLTSFVCGVLLVAIGVVIAGPALIWMGSPEDVLPLATLYLRIYFLGMPFSMAYNFGSAILRAVGDTKRPLYYLFVSGVVNVLLNLLFVIAFSMGVAGVAIATVISQGISAALVLGCLTRSEGDYRLVWEELRIYPDKFFRMLQIGLPAGLQGTVFSLSNVLIQSSVNSFGSIAMAGNSAGANLEGFVYVSMNAFYQTAISFVGQNYGALQFRRIGKIALLCLGLVTAVGLVMGNGFYLLAPVLLRLYSADPEVIAFGVTRMSVICTTYFLCGVMDVCVGLMRGMGHSVLPMIVSLTGACLFRIIWIATVFQQHRTLRCLYISYPVSWLLTFLVHLACFAVVYTGLFRGGSASDKAC